MKVAEFSPLEEFYRVLNRWWLIVLLMLLGGGIGWIFHRAQPPIYETKANLLVHIDFSQTGPLTEYQQDHTIGAVQSLLISQSVEEEFIAGARARGIPEQALYYGTNFVLERRLYNLQMRVSNADPELAAEIANYWAEAGYTALLEAHGHAVRANVLSHYARTLESCGVSVEELNPLCQQMDAKDIPVALEELSASIQAETAASRGITHAVGFDFYQPAEVPERPAAYGANWLILFGALIGFGAAVLVTMLPAGLLGKK